MVNDVLKLSMITILPLLFGLLLVYPITHSLHSTNKNSDKRYNDLVINHNNNTTIEVRMSEFSIPVTITAYNATEAQCDSTPNITASNKKVSERFCALSRDLEETLGLKFSDIIIVFIDDEFYGVYEFQDRMHKRKKRQIDLFMDGQKEAKKFGVKKGRIRIRRTN